MSRYNNLQAHERDFVSGAISLARPWAVKYAAMMSGDDKDRFIFNALRDVYTRADQPAEVRMEARRLAVLIQPPPKNIEQGTGRLLKMPAARKRGGKPTKAELRRWSIMQDIGCIPCILEGELRGEDRRKTPPDMDHLVEGYRVGHSATYASCPWHHRGVPPTRSGQLFKLQSLLGPSKAITPTKYHERYGSDDDLLLIQEQEITTYLDGLVV